MHEPGQAAKRTIGRRVALRANRGIAVGSGNDHLPSLVDRNGCSRLAVRVASTKGGWTRKLAHWLARKHKDMSFHLTLPGWMTTVTWWSTWKCSRSRTWTAAWSVAAQGHGELQRCLRYGNWPVKSGLPDVYHVGLSREVGVNRHNGAKLLNRSCE